MIVHVPAGAVREFSMNSGFPLYWSTTTQLRPPGVRSSGNRSLTSYEPFGPFGPVTDIEDVPGMAAKARWTASSGVIGATPSIGVDGTIRTGDLACTASFNQSPIVPSK